MAENSSELGELGADFWSAFQALDRVELFEETLKKLKAEGRALTLADLAGVLPPTHDLETLSYWLGMAREAGVEFSGEVETIDLEDESEEIFRFVVPLAGLTYEESKGLNTEKLG